VTQTPVRKFAVLVHADVIGSTAVVQKNETLTRERIHDTFQRFSVTINKWGGLEAAVTKVTINETGQ
jgi:hypothetical protein